MSRPDFDSEVGYTYISQMRVLEKHGDPNKVIRHRPPTNDQERDDAKEVRRYLDRSVLGYRDNEETLPIDVGSMAMCVQCYSCFLAQDMRLIKRIWYNSTKYTSQYKCQECYGGIHERSR